MNTEKILWVDDELKILQAVRRNLHGSYNLELATSGFDALKRLESGETYSIVITDLKMPGMDGIEFISRVSQRWPDTVRMMLTGYADLQAAMSAVNEGHIYRFLTKPAPQPILEAALNDALRQCRLIHAEKELLEKTLMGAIQALVNILALANPVAFSSASRIKTLSCFLARRTGCTPFWRIEAAAMLSQLGFITVPGAVIESFYEGTAMDARDAAMVAESPKVSARLLESIPRVDSVGRIIARSQLSNASDAANSEPSSEPYAAHILRVAVAWERLSRQGFSPRAICSYFADRPVEFHAPFVSVLESYFPAEFNNQSIGVPVEQLTEGMVLDQDVRTSNGTLLALRGFRVTDMLRRRLENFRQLEDCPDKVFVRYADSES